MTKTRKVLYSSSRQLGGERTYRSGAQNFAFAIPIPSVVEPKIKVSEKLAGSFVGQALIMASAVHESVRSVMNEPVTWTISAWLEIPWKVNLSKSVTILVEDA